MRKVILMILLAGMSSSAAAAWVEVGATDTYTVYADPATIRKAGNMVKMSDMLDLKTARSLDNRKPYMSTKGQSEYDCEKMQSRGLLVTIHSGNMGGGEVVPTTSKPGNWAPVPPRTLAETLWKLACGKQ